MALDLIRAARHFIGETDDPHDVSAGDDGITINFVNDDTPLQKSLTLEQAQEQLPKATPVEAKPSAAPGMVQRGTNAILEALGRLRPSQLAEDYAAAGPVALGGALQEAKGTYDLAAAEGRRPSLADMAPALSKTLRAAGTSALPFVAPAVAAMSPTALALMGVSGLAAGLVGEGVKHGANKLGVDPRTSELAGDVASYLPPESIAAPLAAKVGLGAMAVAGTRGLRAAVEAAAKKAATSDEGVFAASTITDLLAKLPDASRAKLTAFLGEHPELTDLVRHLTPHEAHLFGSTNAAQKEEFARIAAGLPPTEYFQAAAQGGGAKRGWYAASRKAIEWVYQQEAKLFSGTLASTSPQNAVPMNLDNATRVFRGWTQAGRPTDEASILRIMGENVLGDKGEKSVLDSWKKNTVRVLQNWDAISGPKVNSFWRNLRNDPIMTAMGPIRPQDAVTLDAWMSHLLGVEQHYFSGGVATKAHLAKKSLDAGNPGYGPGYFATSAKLRQAATESGHTPEEMQETMWSWGKALYEQAEKTGESAVSIIERGGLDPKRISDTPDFSTLFHDPKYAGAIAESAPVPGATTTVAERLKTLPKATFPPTRPTTPEEKTWQLKAAKVLDDLRGQRTRAGEFRAGENAPGTVLATSAQEGVSGRGTYFAPELFDKKKFTPAQQQTFGREMLGPDTDLRGRPVIAHAMGLPTTDTSRGIGYWKDLFGKKQFNALNAAGIQVGFAGGAPTTAELAPAITAARMTGLFNAQDATAIHGLVFDRPDTDAIHFLTANKVSQPQFEGLVKLLEKRYPDREFALVNKGGTTQGKQGSTLDILRLDQDKATGKAGLLTAADQRLIEMYLARKGHDIKVSKLGTNIAGDYAGLSEQAGPRLPGELTRQALQHYDLLSKAQQAGLDSDEVKAVATGKLKVLEDYGKQITVPPEYTNLYQIVAKDGVSGLRKVLQNGSQLLPVLLMLGLVGRQASQPDQTEPKS